MTWNLVHMLIEWLVFMSSKMNKIGQSGHQLWIPDPHQGWVYGSKFQVQFSSNLEHLYIRSFKVILQKNIQIQSLGNQWWSMKIKKPMATAEEYIYCPLKIYLSLGNYWRWFLWVMHSWLICSTIRILIYFFCYLSPFLLIFHTILKWNRL